MPRRDSNNPLRNAITSSGGRPFELNIRYDSAQKTACNPIAHACRIKEEPECGHNQARDTIACTTKSQTAEQWCSKLLYPQTFCTQVRSRERWPCCPQVESASCCPLDTGTDKLLNTCARYAPGKEHCSKLHNHYPKHSRTHTPNKTTATKRKRTSKEAETNP